jgi:hypothetical protein
LNLHWKRRVCCLLCIWVSGHCSLVCIHWTCHAYSCTQILTAFWNTDTKGNRTYWPDLSQFCLPQVRCYFFSTDGHAGELYSTCRVCFSRRHAGNPDALKLFMSSAEFYSQTDKDPPTPALVWFTSFSCSHCQRMRAHVEVVATVYRHRLPTYEVRCEGECIPLPVSRLFASRHAFAPVLYICLADNCSAGFQSNPSASQFCAARGVSEYPTLALFTVRHTAK